MNELAKIQQLDEEQEKKEAKEAKEERKKVKAKVELSVEGERANRASFDEDSSEMATDIKIKATSTKKLSNPTQFVRLARFIRFALA